MRDLENAFDVIERVPMPEIWDRAAVRADHLPPGGLDFPMRRTPVRQRVTAGIVAFAMFGLIVALALGAVLDRRQPGPGSTGVVDTVTISFSAVQPTSVMVNGERLEGEMRNGFYGSRVAYEFFPDRMPSVAAGSHVVVHGVSQARGWITSCCDYGIEGPRRLSELDLASAVMPNEPGTYFVELSVNILGATGQGAPGEAPYTFLFPVRVVPSDGA